MRRNPDWTDKELSALRDGWKTGMSKTQIAKWVGRSKSAVAGMLHRLGLKLSPEERRRREDAGRALAKKLRKKSNAGQSTYDVLTATKGD